MTPEAAMVEYYARRAREYEFIYEKPERQAELKVLRELLEKSFGGRQVLEVACGTGYWTEVVAQTAQSVLGLDINEQVFAIARAKRIDFTKVSFAVADVYDLKITQGRFDAGLACFWLSHVPRFRLRSFFEMFHRHLQPGSLVILMDNAFDAGSSTPVSRRDSDGNNYQLRKLSDGTTHEVLKNFLSETDLREVLEGLAEGIQVKFLRYYWTLQYTVGASGSQGEQR